MKCSLGADAEEAALGFLLPFGAEVRSSLHPSRTSSQPSSRLSVYDASHNVT